MEDFEKNTEEKKSPAEEYIGRAKSQRAKELVDAFFRSRISDLTASLNPENEMLANHMQNTYLERLRAEGEEEIAHELEKFVGTLVEKEKKPDE